MTYGLTHGGTKQILNNGSVSHTFSCQNLAYGYYVDVDSDCKIFHFCVPVNNDEGYLVNTLHYTFKCPDQTLFSQNTLTCTQRDDTIPCGEA
ncbi:UNVERIFIED_CONTAM: hypothetical protein GTU68_019314 [Idotea baltica]|nr:hypothetical protein [Idotea baltica]